MKVPLLDIDKQYAPLKEELLQAIAAALEVQPVCNGPAVRQLEREIAEYSGCQFGVGVSSGTDGLLCSLMTLEIGDSSGGPRATEADRDEVITTAFTFFATGGAIWRSGARPVFVDIDPVTFNIDPARIEAAITPRTRAIMPVHLYGQVADMDAICEIADRHGLAIIEDAAQAIGAGQGERKAGAFGTAGVFSFYPTKNLGAPGDAGMIVTQDSELAEKLAFFRNHGSAGSYLHTWVGGNFRMDSIQGALISVKLKHLAAWENARREHAAIYNERLAGCEGVTTPVELQGNRHVYNQYVIRSERRDELRAYLSDNGIASAMFYPLGLHQQPCFASLGYKEGDFPLTEQASHEVLALPISHEITEEQIRCTAEAIRAFSA